MSCSLILTCILNAFGIHDIKSSSSEEACYDVTQSDPAHKICLDVLHAFFLIPIIRAPAIDYDHCSETVHYTVHLQLDTLSLHSPLRHLSYLLDSFLSKKSAVDWKESLSEFLLKELPAIPFRIDHDGRDIRVSREHMKNTIVSGFETATISFKGLSIRNSDHGTPDPTQLERRTLLTGLSLLRSSAAAAMIAPAPAPASADSDSDTDIDVVVPTTPSPFKL